MAGTLAAAPSRPHPSGDLLWTRGTRGPACGRRACRQEEVAAAGFEEPVDDEPLDDEVPDEPDEPDEEVPDVLDVPEEVLDDEEEASVEVLDDDVVEEDEPERESVR
ncbi:hypothetical protein GCM10028777_27510 [Angustibacter speluncae]